MKRGTYRYSETLGVYPTITYRWHTLRVEIVTETEKTYEVKLLDFHATNGKRPGDKMRVKRSNVVIDKEPAPNVTPATGEIDIRLPYKDND